MGSLYGRTKRVSLAGGNAPIQYFDRAPQLVATFSSEEAKPITLLVSVSRSTFPNNQVMPVHSFLPANNLMRAEPTDVEIGRSGALILEYGAGAARNYLFADLKPGAYALPVCDFAQVSVNTWYPHASVSSVMPTVDVACTFLEGQHRNPARFTATCITEIAANSSYSDLKPAQARWVDVQGGHLLDPGLVIVTEGNFRFLEESSDFGNSNPGRYILHDTSNQVFRPDATPVELSCLPAFRTWNDSGAAAVIATKFFLEL